ncbi:MAG: DUF4320 family protein [Dethiobacteraceae bacterium]
MKKLKITLLNALKCNKGMSEMTSFVIMSWVVIILMFAGIDIFMASSRFMDVNNAAQMALDMMKDEGRLTGEIEELFYKELALNGISKNDVKIVSATRTETSRGEQLHFHVRTRYVITSFRPLGIDEKLTTLVWNIRKSGVSRLFKRRIVWGVSSSHEYAV